MTQESLSYRDAGVDIDAGDELVERIKPLARKTLRQGVLGGIGGFGALFEVPKSYREPVLVSGTDGEPELHWRLARDLPAVQLDPVQIGQVVLNLVRNSLAALRGQASRSLEIVTRRREDMVEVLVRDNGPGIPAGVRENIFEPFHNSTTGGMGIGLSLCRTILEAHRGRIWLGAPLEGAEVIFSLPMQGGHDARSP